MSFIAVVGLGCVGFPLAVESGKKRNTIGFDFPEEKIGSYQRYIAGNIAT